MSDDGIGVVLVLVEEVGNARECDLVDIFVNLLLGHADASVADGQRAFLGVEAYAHGEVAQFALEVAAFGKRLQLLCSVDGVRHHLAEENLMV